MKNKSKVTLLVLAAILILSEFLQPRSIIFFQHHVFLPEYFLFSTPLTEPWVSFEELDLEEIDLLLDIEDKNYYSHGGYSPADIQSAIFGYLGGKKLRGASTITQQLSRTLFLNREKTAKRKFTEIEIAALLNRNMSKNEILEYYINNIYWGHGLYGISQAAIFYFKKDAEFLNSLQLKILFSILKKPDRYSQSDINRIYTNQKLKN